MWNLWTWRVGVSAGAQVQVEVNGMETEHRANTAGVIAIPIDAAQGAQIRVGVRPGADAARSAAPADPAAATP